MKPAQPATLAHLVRDLPPNIFAVVMATGIVALALNGAGHTRAAQVLFWLNVILSVALSALFLVRVLCHRDHFTADLRSHAKAPGFFTMVAAPCVLGNQCVLQFGAAGAALALWIVGGAFWLALTYVLLPLLIAQPDKPKPEAGISGAWLLVVVGTQAISVLASLLVSTFSPNSHDVLLFVALSFWLVGSMLYVWLIALIFHRIVFLPLSPGELTPPYWINMGAMAISTLAGVRLIGEANRMPLLIELQHFLKGMTLLFWATGSWWIPILLALGVWRHFVQRAPLRYDHGYWAAVFPLGMYTVATQNLIRVVELPFLKPIAAAFVWIALAAWCLTFAGMMWTCIVPYAAENTNRLQP